MSDKTDNFISHKMVLLRTKTLYWLLAAGWRGPEKILKFDDVPGVPVLVTSEQDQDSVKHEKNEEASNFSAESRVEPESRSAVAIAKPSKQKHWIKRLLFRWHASAPDLTSKEKVAV